jgi:hypothetical protein
MGFSMKKIIKILLGNKHIKQAPIPKNDDNRDTLENQLAKAEILGKMFKDVETSQEKQQKKVSSLSRDEIEEARRIKTTVIERLESMLNDMIGKVEGPVLVPLGDFIKDLNFNGDWSWWLDGKLDQYDANDILTRIQKRR